MRNALVVLVVFMAVFLASHPSHAITIVMNGAWAGTKLDGTNYVVERPDGRCMFPAGTVRAPDVIRAAADYWETIYPLPYTITIEWGFTELPKTIAAQARVTQVQQSSPGRGLIQAGSIAINRHPEGCWYVDTRPETWGEYPASGLVISTDIPYPGRKGKFIEDQRHTIFPTTSGDTSGMDLYTVMLHEIGHLLGMHSGIQNYTQEVRDGDIDVRTWHVIPGVSWMSSEGHLTYPGLPQALMSPYTNPGRRKWPSQADISTISQLSGWWTTSWGAGGGGVRGAAASNPLNE